ncbi:hypothetical protein [Mycolicibacterium komossense]|uniref:Proline rich protein n=1 Tax=Mycolicibacterium komossense TaxID=1779 RepID=A0ABT3C8V7_9MYCO|nr:hypothetical protein [Mycolicibacterium komossense]MCV7225910.1 hypothetical protein [Mycolicibacterium komossense]
MSETPQYETEPTTSPVVTPPPPATYDTRPAYVEPRKPSRLYQVAAWVAIVAGSVFIVAVIFFTGFALGVHSGGGHHGHHRQDMGETRQEGPPMMPMRPGFLFPGPGAFGPGGPGMFPGGPGQMGPGGPGGQGGPGFGPGPGNGGPGQSQQPPAPGQQRPS